MLGVEERMLLTEQLSNGCPWDVLPFSGGDNNIAHNPMELMRAILEGTPARPEATPTCSLVWATSRRSAPHRLKASPDGPIQALPD
jgi:hypothetical protein